MFAFAPPGEISKRDLACDDKNAIVFKYPAGGPNGYCTPTASCGFCAPPGALQNAPTVSVQDTDNGGGGCQGNTGPNGPWPAGAAGSTGGRGIASSRTRG